MYGELSLKDEFDGVGVSASDQWRIQGGLTPAPSATGIPLAVTPSHYTRFVIQPAEFCIRNKLNFGQSNAIKYICRFPFKNGLEDLYKARKMVDMLIAAEEGRLTEFLSQDQQKG